MFRGRFVAILNTPCLKDYVEEESIIRHRQNLGNKVQIVISCDSIEATKGMQVSFLTGAGGNKRDTSSG